MAFTEETITDQKRLVRGEHLQYGRGMLRARDEIHHKPWRVLMLAGGAPRGAIEAIRSVMPKAYIVACDFSQENVDLALANGASEGVACDLLDFVMEIRNSGYTSSKVYFPPPPIRALPKFDFVDLDFCSTPSGEMKRAIKVYLQHTNAKGVLTMTFSYGRDVSEIYEKLLRHASYKEHGEWLMANGVPRSVAGRLLYVLPMGVCLHSVMVYRGAAMPMCSILIENTASKHAPELSLVRVEPGDYELAVCYPEAASLYDCPQERIESLRRKFAAIKAHLTMKAAKEKPTGVLFES